MRGVFCYYLIIKGKARRAGHNPGAEVGGVCILKKAICEESVKIRKTLDFSVESGIIVIRRKGNLKKQSPTRKFWQSKKLG